MPTQLNNNIPQPTDIIAQSQSQLLSNTNNYPTYISIDHEPIETISAGKHKQTTFFANSAVINSPPNPNGTEVMVDARLAPVNRRFSQNRLDINIARGVNINYFVFTGYNITRDDIPLNQHRLPSGILITYYEVVTGINGLVEFNVNQDSWNNPYPYTTIYQALCLSKTMRIGRDDEFYTAVDYSFLNELIVRVRTFNVSGDRVRGGVIIMVIGV